MSINLEHHFFCKKENHNWIYFGNNFLNLKRVENTKGEKNKINLKKNNYINYTREKIIYLKWLEDQRKYFNDSLNWWMNGIASKNNLSIDILKYISQFSSIREFLIGIGSEQKLTIVCENYHSMKFLIENLKNNFNLEIPKFLIALTCFEKIILIMRGSLHYLSPENDIYLFHDLINSSSFNKSPVQSRYYGDYPDWLEKKGHQVFSLPWFYKNINNKLKLYKNLRTKNSFIPEDWMNFSDYTNSIYNSIKSNFTINEKINFPSCNISQLLKLQKLSSFSFNNSTIYFRYIPAFKKWSKNINSLKYFDHFQNQNYEHPLRFIIKELKMSAKSFGYYHSLHSKDYFPYITNKEEWKSKVKPDLVFCPNNLCRDHLISLGTPIEKFNKNLLIILSLFSDTNYEILFKISKLNQFITDQLGLDIKVRSHPYLKKERILKDLKWQFLPKKWKWSEEDLENDLLNSYSVITMNSAVITDLILHDCIPIILQSDLGVAENYLDHFQDKYFILEKTLEKKIGNKIKDIYFNKREFYRKELSKVSDLIKANHFKDNYSKILS